MTRYAILHHMQPHATTGRISSIHRSEETALKTRARVRGIWGGSHDVIGPLVTLNHDPLTSTAVPGDTVEVDGDGIATKVKR